MNPFLLGKNIVQTLSESALGGRGKDSATWIDPSQRVKIYLLSFLFLQTFTYFHTKTATLCVAAKWQQLTTATIGEVTSSPAPNGSFGECITTLQGTESVPVLLSIE